MTEQKVVPYYNWESLRTIQENMDEQIKSGWRVHTCLNKNSDILVVYEREAVK